MATSSTSGKVNPLLADWDAPFGFPPFDLIRAEHFEPAFDAALASHLCELDEIAAQSEAPTFDNTLAAFDCSGVLLKRIRNLFDNLCASESTPALQVVERAIMPRLAAHDSAVYMHGALFARLQAVKASLPQGKLSASQLSEEQRRLLDRVHLDFVRAGAQLDANKQLRYAAIMQRLAELGTSFGQNVLADEAGFQLLLRHPEELAGLPDFVRAAARQAAQERGISEGWLVTLSRSHVMPFLTFSTRRDLRERVFKAWSNRGDEQAGSAHGNAAIVREMLQLRLEQAQLHGCSSFAEYALQDRMAGKPDAVNRLLAQVWEPACVCAGAELEALKAQARLQGHSEPLAPWDWRFYAEQVRQARYDLDEAEVKPYFALHNMAQAIFDCAQRLFGLQFALRPELKAYHPDVQVYEVTGDGGVAVGLFLHDNFARASKRGGAWMSAFRWQSRVQSAILPIIVNNNNFAKGAPGEPTLLSFEDARTLFHEFGHGLHGLLSNVNYERLSGTNVLQDFVELPSQLFEHWLSEPEVLKRHARHVQTGETIPDALIAKLMQARKFNQGYDTVQYTASAIVDMEVHAITSADALATLDINTVERSVLERFGMPEAVTMNHRLLHFRHLFSGDSYAAGYYVYLWAEVLDADGFGAFQEAGDPFNKELSGRLKRFIYSSGNTLEPGAAYRAFRGRDATPEAMLRKRGLLAEISA
jgi:peptidyl-dipeptidase Dcp